ncbi:hypothetical protein [Paraburkholderia sp. 40]|uniref:hypothetical protein n=1 Tax=unclassified Paraburkholderia TaxID=2615204 RepID=UPI003D2041EF
MHMTNVVQHQLPGESTQFVNLVRKWTSMLVCAAKNGERPEPAHESAMHDLMVRFADALRGRSG